MFCTFSFSFYFIGDKIAADCFTDKITLSLKASDMIKFSQYVASNHVREKGEQRWKLSYILLKEEDGYNPLFDISPYPTLI